MTSSAGCCARNGSSAPRAAPPAPSSSTRLPLQRDAEVALDVVDEANAVEVVGDDAVAVELQRVRRAGELGALQAVRSRISKASQLERRGDVHAASALRRGTRDGVGEAVERSFDRDVFEILTASACANVPWISGDLLWPIGLPMTA